MAAVESQAPFSPSEIIRRLRGPYGTVAWRPHGDAMSELVLTLLSQNTSDSNSGRAFARLLERFPDWETLTAAPLPEIEDAIRPGGLAPTKAPRLKAMLAEIEKRVGSFDLSFLREASPAEAWEWVRTLPAVGPKTAACVLVFALGLPALPVDTHVYRVVQRLGLVSAKLTPEKVQDFLEQTVPPDLQFEFHILLIRHGRHTCTARSPACGSCPLLLACPAGAALAGAPASQSASRQT